VTIFDAGGGSFVNLDQVVRFQDRRKRDPQGNIVGDGDGIELHLMNGTTQMARSNLDRLAGFIQAKLVQEEKKLPAKVA